LDVGETVGEEPQRDAGGEGRERLLGPRDRVVEAEVRVQELLAQRRGVVRRRRPRPRPQLREAPRPQRRDVDLARGELEPQLLVYLEVEPRDVVGRRAIALQAVTAIEGRERLAGRAPVVVEGVVEVEPDGRGPRGYKAGRRRPPFRRRRGLDAVG